MDDHHLSSQPQPPTWWQTLQPRVTAWGVAVQLRRDQLYRWVDQPLRALVGVLIFLGLGTLVITHGFDVSPAWTAWVRIIRHGVVWGMVGAFALRLVLISQPWAFIKNQAPWVAFVMLFGLSFLALQTSLGVSWFRLAFGEATLIDRAAVYMAGVQSFIVLIAVLEGAYYSRRIATWQLRPAQALVLSFVALILAGSLMLMLPKATSYAGSMPLLHAVFTATSAVCVTGLSVVVDTSAYFTRFGQGIILVLCQLGGLGILTFATVIGLMLRGGIGLREKMLVSDFPAGQPFGGIAVTVRRIVGLTLLIEVLGAVCLYWALESQVPEAGQRLWHAIFHAVSAFCNAGFSTFSDSLAGKGMASHLGINVTVMVLILLGGFGFTVLWETFQWLAGAVANNPPRLSVQSRLVWMATGILVGLGAVGFALLEAKGALAGCTGSACWLGALFQSVTARTAGFNTLALDTLAVPTVLLMTILMVIGVAPGSTGGGMKITTVAVLLMGTVATIRGQARVEAFRRTLPWEIVQQAYAIFFFFITCIGVSLFILTITETHPLLDLFFEEISALATVGLSRGVTPSLSSAGQVVIIASMFIGRVGSLTLAVALARQVSTTAYEYPTETVLVG